jgi:hypothetical protein
VHEWHDALVRETYTSLSLEEQRWVEEWRDRTYRHYNPIDRGPDMPMPNTSCTPQTYNGTGMASNDPLDRTRAR